MVTLCIQQIKVEVNGAESQTIVPPNNAADIKLDNSQTKEFCLGMVSR